MMTANFLNNSESTVFSCAIYIFCISEAVIRIYADINRKHSAGKRKTSDFGSVFVVVLGLVGSFGLNFLLSSNYMPWFISRLNLPHFFYFIGLTLMLGGLVLRDVSVLTLKRYFTVLVQVTSEQQLIQNGVYKRLRNPAYTGMLLFIVGVAISLRSAIAAVVSLFVFTLCLSIRIRVEEKALREKFGDEFEKYCAHTWRLVPFIW